MLENLHEQIIQSRSTRLCTVGKFYADLDDDDRTRLDRLFADPDLLSSEIAKALQQHVRIAPSTVARHRRRAAGNGCGCPW